MMLDEHENTSKSKRALNFAQTGALLRSDCNPEVTVNTILFRFPLILFNGYLVIFKLYIICI